ncbi:MAG: F0F1 ATP synthase subunit delta [Actinobacteria bacterium]|nr:F0F1 ATP synthase subunit delta [Actinomycetota bacterium]
MQAASRTSLASARERLDGVIDGTGPDELARLGEELFAVAQLLHRERDLRRNLADHAAPESSRGSLLQSLLTDHIGKQALETVTGVVTSRWSRPVDMVDAVEELGRQAIFGIAEQDSSLEEVEDELFRFGRVLDTEPKLATLLGDETGPVEGRLELLRRVLGDAAQPVTRQLLEHAVRMPRRRNFEELVTELVERAAARRERYIAYVTAAGSLSEAQEQRLLDALGRIYHRSISLRVQLDPDLLGGLVIRVGDEVIDGSVSGRLERARQWLPH